jgi:lysophospholipase L1-like esterase
MTILRWLYPRLITSAAALVVSLLALEVGVRLINAFDQNYLDALDYRRPVRTGQHLTLADLIRVNPDDLIVYDLRPRVRGIFQGQEVSINSFGFRDEVRPRVKKPQTFRIVGLGDSHMFGWGVAQDQTFVAVLERLLAERSPRTKFEVWNTAVPGYNTVQEVEAFAARADELMPDLVVINYVDNDMDLPNFLAKRPNLWSLRRSFAKELIDRRRSFLSGESQDPIRLYATVSDERTGRFLFDSSRIPKRYRRLVGWDQMEGAFDRLATICKQRGIRPVLLINIDDYTNRLARRTTDIRPGRVRELAAHCANEGYLVVDPQDRITAYLQAHRLDSTAVWLSPSNTHMNVLRHGLVAEELLQRLEESGLVPAATAPHPRAGFDREPSRHVRVVPPHGKRGKRQGGRPHA